MQCDAYKLGTSFKHALGDCVEACGNVDGRERRTAVETRFAHLRQIAAEGHTGELRAAPEHVLMQLGHVAAHDERLHGRKVGNCRPLYVAVKVDFGGGAISKYSIAGMVQRDGLVRAAEGDFGQGRTIVERAPTDGCH